MAPFYFPAVKPARPAEPSKLKPAYRCLKPLFDGFLTEFYGTAIAKLTGNNGERPTWQLNRI